MPLPSRSFVVPPRGKASEGKYIGRSMNAVPRTNGPNAPASSLSVYLLSPLLSSASPSPTVRSTPRSPFLMNIPTSPMTGTSMDASKLSGALLSMVSLAVIADESWKNTFGTVRSLRSTPRFSATEADPPMTRSPPSPLIVSPSASSAPVESNCARSRSRGRRIGAGLYSKPSPKKNCES